MSAATPRALPAAAAVLGVAIVVLAMLWWTRATVGPAVPERPPLRAGLPGADATDAATLPATSRVTRADDSGAANAGTAPGAASGATTAVLFGAVTWAQPPERPQGVLGLHSDGVRVAYEATSDVFQFAGLKPGRYMLRGESSDCLPLELEVDVRAPQTRLDVRFEQAWLLAVNVVGPGGEPYFEVTRAVTPAGRMPLELNAIATRTPLAGDLPPTSSRQATGGVGKFRSRMHGGPLDGPKQVADHTLGIFALPLDEPVCVSLLLRNVVLATQPVAAGQEEVTFTLAAADLRRKLATVRLRIVDGGGAPVAGVRVELRDSQSSGPGTPTDADGRVTLEQLRPGILILDVYGPQLLTPDGREFAVLPPPVQVSVPPGAELDLGDVPLLPPNTITLVAEGLGEGGSIHANWLEPLSSPHLQVHSWHLGNRADAGERRLHPGRYRITARDRTQFAELEIDTRALAGQTVRIPLRKAPALRVQNRAGDEILRVALRDANGRAVLRREFTGKYEYDWPLPAGEYTAEITDLRGKVTTKKLTLAAGGATLVVP